MFSTKQDKMKQDKTKHDITRQKKTKQDRISHIKAELRREEKNGSWVSMEDMKEREGKERKKIIYLQCPPSLPELSWSPLTVSHSKEHCHSPARKFKPLSVASAFAISVFEQPGGPYSKIPWFVLEIKVSQSVRYKHWQVTSSKSKINFA